MSQEEKKQTAPETEAAAEKPETPAQEAPEKEAPQTEEKHEGKHDCKHHHHETAALQAKLEAEEKKNADLKNQLLRTAAEYDNYRKRSQREADQKFNDGVSHAVTQILGILDTLDMAANAACADENYKKGVTMTLDKAAKACGTYTAFVSNYINSPAANIADAFFCTSGVDDMKSITGRESNLTILTLFGSLIVLMARKTAPQQD
mgnify:CR=1 FL=1